MKRHCQTDLLKLFLLLLFVSSVQLANNHRVSWLVFFSFVVLFPNMEIKHLSVHSNDNYNFNNLL